FCSRYLPLPALPSFPTRRSSDLVAVFALRRGGRQPAAPRLAPHCESVSNEQPERAAKDYTGRGLHRAGVPDPVLDAPNFCTAVEDRKSTRLNSSHVSISYAVFCL